MSLFPLSGPGLDAMERPFGLPVAEEGRENVRCQECSTWFRAVPGWRCPACGRTAAYAVQPGQCPACGQRCEVVRQGHDISRVLCRCSETSEVRARRQQDEHRRQQRELQEAAMEQVVRERLRNEQALRGLATSCYAGMQRQGGCKQPKGAFPECRVCKRWLKQRRNDG